MGGGGSLTTGYQNCFIPTLKMFTCLPYGTPPGGLLIHALDAAHATSYMHPFVLCFTRRIRKSVHIAQNHGDGRASAQLAGQGRVCVRVCHHSSAELSVHNLQRDTLDMY